MAPVADVVKLLRSAGDLLGLFSLLPLLSEVKYGKILRLQRGETVVVRERLVPAAWSLGLVLAAELCDSARIFDSSDTTTRKAFRHFMKLQKKKAEGLEQSVQLLGDLLQNAEVFVVLRCVSLCAGLAGLMIISAMKGLDEEDTKARKGGRVLGLLKSLPSLLSSVWSFFQPQLLLFVALAACFAIGRWSLLLKFIRNAAVAETLRNSASLLRALGFVGAVGSCSFKGPVPQWALLNGAAAVARVCRLMVYERLSFGAVYSSLLDQGKGLAPTTLAVLGCEAWVFVALLPCVLAHPRKLAILAMLAAPCVAFVYGGPAAALFEPLVQPVLEKANLGVAVVALLILFIGGLPVMATALSLLSFLNWLHNLEKTKI
eukprot:TRINITY_DN42316_c0_g1_i1.p1 TRINITY_DN42316_c0_g1~~TRINITY_DN42316_c0_g1_i1.p1  ORF type:complete len:384 (-),score=70.83 TRINITY_DN42316_c0_g1_i1:157-1278(-)